MDKFCNKNIELRRDEKKRVTLREFLWKDIYYFFNMQDITIILKESLGKGLIQ